MLVLLICSENSCIVNGTDAFKDFRESIGQKGDIMITLNGSAVGAAFRVEKGVPVHKDWFPVDGKCTWRYEIDGLWSSSGNLFVNSLLVVITLTVIIGVFLIAVIVFTIMVLKRRNASRQKLGESLVADPESVLCVSFQPYDDTDGISQMDSFRMKQCLK